MDQGNDTGNDGAPAKGDQAEVTARNHLMLAARHYAAAAKKNYKVASDYVRKGAKAIIWLLRYSWRGAGAIAKWLDSHNGLVTAAATLAIAVLTYYVVQFTADQGQITNRQLSVMEDEQRPWIKVDLDVASDLTFSETSAYVTIRSHLQNIGHSPAFNVVAAPEINQMRSVMEVDALLKQRCDKTTELIFNQYMIGWGNILFPGDIDQIDERVSVALPKQEPPAAKPPPSQTTVNPYGINPTSPDTINPVSPYITAPIIDPALLAPSIRTEPLLLSCVFYTSSGIVRRPHHTAESLYLTERPPADSPDWYTALDLAAHKTIPRERLYLFRPQFEWRRYGD